MGWERAAGQELSRHCAVATAKKLYAGCVKQGQCLTTFDYTSDAAHFKWNAFEWVGGERALRWLG